MFYSKNYFKYKTIAAAIILNPVKSESFFGQDFMVINIEKYYIFSS